MKINNIKAENYSILIGRNSISLLSKNIKKLCPKTKNVAIIFDSKIPKQYFKLGEKTIIRHAIDAFLEHPGIDKIRVVRRPQDKHLYEKSVTGISILEPADGGKTRQE